MGGYSDVGTRNGQARDQWAEKKLSDLPSGWRILDAGAGEQQYRKLCSHLRYVSQDFADYKPEALSAGLHMAHWDYGELDLVCDITCIPEPAGSFDAIMCLEVLEHVPDPVKAIHELSRLLRKGGRLIISAPFCSLTHFAPYHFSTGFSRYFYEKHLPDCGLRIVELCANGNYFEYIAQELRRLDSIAGRYAHLRSMRIERLAMRVILRMLERLSKADEGSSELLAFGFHVVAEKY